MKLNSSIFVALSLFLFIYFIIFIISECKTYRTMLNSFTSVRIFNSWLELSTTTSTSTTTTTTTTTQNVQKLVEQAWSERQAVVAGHCRNQSGNLTDVQKTQTALLSFGKDSSFTYGFYVDELNEVLMCM